MSHGVVITGGSRICGWGVFFGVFLRVGRLGFRDFCRGLHLGLGV